MLIFHLLAGSQVVTYILLKEGRPAMEFLKRFWRETEESCRASCDTSFDEISIEALDAHLSVDRYGEFLLTEAIRPSFDVKIRPRSGYRHDSFKDGAHGKTIPVLAGAASRDQLFDLFIDLIDPLGERVDVVLESSHDAETDGHIDMYREDIDLVVLKSLLYDYEDLIMKDGYTGLAVLRPDVPMEVQFDEHKLLFVYAKDITPFERVLQSYGLKRDDNLKLISEGEHLHLTEERFVDQFNELKMRIGVEE
jgi:hypothetical protein